MTGATAIKVIHNHDNVYVATFYYLFQVNVFPDGICMDPILFQHH